MKRLLHHVVTIALLSGCATIPEPEQELHSPPDGWQVSIERRAANLFQWRYVAIIDDEEVIQLKSKVLSPEELSAAAEFQDHEVTLSVHFKDGFWGDHQTATVLVNGLPVARKKYFDLSPL